MSPKEFKEEVVEITNRVGHDKASYHYEIDDLMENLLRELGYGEGVVLINKTTRWYE